jgi:hypothetical protein
VERVKDVHANDRHKARHILNVLKGFQKSAEEIKEYKRLLDSVRDHLKRNCKEFSMVFFHGKTKGKTSMCPAKILQIIMTIIGVLLGPIVGVSFIRALSSPINRAFSFAWGAANTRNVFGEVSTVSATAAFLDKMTIGHVSPLLRGFRFPRPRSYLVAKASDEDSEIDDYETEEAFTNLVYVTLSHFSPVPTGNVWVGAVNGPMNPLRYGGFGMIESLDTWDLSSEDTSVYDQSKIGAEMVFKKFPLPADTKWDGAAKGEPLSGQEPAFKGRYANRITRFFNIFENRINERQRLLISDNFDDNILGFLVDKELRPMSLDAALAFFEKVGPNITDRYLSPQAPVAELATSHISIPVSRWSDFIPEFVIQVRNDHLPWSAILSGLEFKGTRSVNAAGGDKDASADLHWRASHSGMTGKSKRYASSSSAANQIGHELLGKMNALEGLNILEPTNPWKRGKRDSPSWEVKQHREGNDDIFSVNVRGHKFHNDIHHVQCGTSYYTGYTENNEKKCHQFKDDVMDRIESRMLAAYEEANTTPIAMARYMLKRFGTYSTWRNVDTLKKKYVEEKLFQNLKNSLVSKAYDDGNCFVRCGNGSYYHKNDHGPSVSYGGIACQTGYYDPIQNRHERLYGFSGSTRISEGRATKEPWNLDEKSMNVVAVTAWTQRSQYGYFPGYINMNPYVPLLQDQSPILPVCYSDLRGQQLDALVCSCGNQYGDMTEAFARTVNLKAETKQDK